jgi:hypothetical protein
MYRHARSLPLLALAVLTSGCSLEQGLSAKGSTPAAVGLSVTSTASPDALPRDGRSTSLVQLFVRDDDDAAVAGQRFTVRTTAGTLSATDVMTDSNGIATVRFTAPPASTNASSATIVLTPVAGTRAATTGPRTVIFALGAPSI